MATNTSAVTVEDLRFLSDRMGRLAQRVDALERQACAAAAPESDIDDVDSCPTGLPHDADAAIAWLVEYKGAGGVSEAPDGRPWRAPAAPRGR